MAATCIIQPIDMVKVRIQIGAKGGPVSDRNPFAANTVYWYLGASCDLLLYVVLAIGMSSSL